MTRPNHPVPPALRALGSALVALIGASAAPPARAQDLPGDLTQIGFERLLALEVSTASRKGERWSDAGVAVHVITSDDLRRLGVTTIPEALRLVPGMHVARIDASKWAVGVRGFASRLSRSLLVMIDGRTVYSPLFAGVYWEVQDTLIEDIERIEVIRGPGGTLWGANAVNGVVNIITKPSSATQGSLATLGGGVEERAFGAARVGGTLGDTGHYRVFARGFDRDAGFHGNGPPGQPEFDPFWMGRGGFRADWEPRPDRSFTLQSEVYAGRAGQRTTFGAYNPPGTMTVFGDADLGGGHVLGGWQARAPDGSAKQLRFYYDRTERREPSFSEDRDTYDIDFQHQITAPARHDIVWGAGYRVTADRTGGVETVEFAPRSRTDALASAFVQDSIALGSGSARLTVGSKFEHNDYSGFEVQPAAGLVWNRAAHTFWGRVARAVRTPSRIEHDLVLTAFTGGTSFIRVTGDEDFESEALTTVEAGYHGELSAGWFVAATSFFNRYDDLLTLEAGVPFMESGRTIQPLFIDNQMTGRGRGFELLIERQFRDTLRLAGSYSYLDLDLETDAGSTDASTRASAEGTALRHRAFLRASWNPRAGLEVESFLRWVDDLPAQGVGSYLELDAAFHWPLRPGLRLSAVGRNLLHRRHAEFGGAAAAEIERALFLMATGRW